MLLKFKVRFASHCPDVLEALRPRIMVMQVLNELIFQRFQTFGQLNFSHWRVFQSLQHLLEDGVDPCLLVPLFLFDNMLQLLPQLHF